MFIIDPQAPVLPQWINGRAYLCLAPAYFDIRDPQGKILRRTPLCSSDIALAAADAARTAQPLWNTTERPARLAHVLELATRLESYRAHFTGLLAEENCPEPETEFNAALHNLRNATASAQTGHTCALLVEQPAGSFSSACAVLARLLIEGSSVVLVPNPAAPSALLALAELASSQGLPPGVVNIVFGDTTFGAVLAALPQIDATFLIPEPDR